MTTRRTFSLALSGVLALPFLARAQKRVPDTGKVAKGWLRYLRVTHHSAIGRAPRNPLGLKIPSPKAFNLKNNPGASTSFRGLVTTDSK